MKIIHALAFLFITSTIAAQTKPDQISFTKSFWGNKFYQNGKEYNFNEVVQLMKKNQEAYDLIRQSRSNTTLAGVIGFIGGGLMGWPIGAAIAGKEMDWAVFGAGVAVTAVSIPIALSGDRKLKKAVEVWNASLAVSTFHKNELACKVKLSPLTAGIVIDF